MSGLSGHGKDAPAVNVARKFSRFERPLIENAIFRRCTSPRKDASGTHKPKPCLFHAGNFPLPHPIRVCGKVEIPLPFCVEFSVGKVWKFSFSGFASGAKTIEFTYECADTGIAATG